MQVASTLWPDIKSQKISEHRFRLKWTKCSPRIKFKPLKTSQDQRGSDKAAQDSPPEEVGGGWSPWAVGRPPWSADQARRPYLLNSATCRLPVECLRRFCRSHLVAPCYKYKGRG